LCAAGAPGDGAQAVTSQVSVTALVEQMCTGAQRPLARLISMVEREDAAVPEIMQRLYPRLGKAYSIGITGPPVGARVSSSTD